VDHRAEYERVRDFCAKLPGPNFLLKDLIAMADTPIVV
jgi:hypothetical protein